MENSNQNTAATLHELTLILDDGRVGFQNASVYVDSQELKESFLEYSRERNFYIEQLQDEIDHHTKDIDVNQEVVVTSERTWIDLEPVLTSGDEHDIVIACIRGEEAVISKFNSALEEKGLSKRIRSIIENQLLEIKKTVSIIKINRLML